MAIIQSKITKTTLGLALAFAVWNGCRKDVDLFIEHPATVSDVAAALEKLAQNDAPATVFDLKSADPNAVLSLPNGSRLLLGSSADDLFADAATGAEVACSACAEAKLEAVLAFSKGQMLGRRLAGATGGQPLDHFGAVLFSATCDGKSLRLRDGKSLRLQTPFSAASDAPLGLFLGEKNAKNQLVWTASGDVEGVLAAQWPLNNESQSGYEWKISQLGWAAAAKAGPTVSSLACATMAAPQNPQNLLVFAVLKNQKMVVEFSATARPYQVCAPGLPVGEPIDIVAVAQIGGKWSLARFETVVEIDRAIDLAGRFSETDETALADLLKNL